MFKLPVIMLEMMSGRMTSFSIRMRISPGKPKYCLWRWERDAYSLTTTPKLIPERSAERQSNCKEFWFQLKEKSKSLDHSMHIYMGQAQCNFIIKNIEINIISIECSLLCKSNSHRHVMSVRFHPYRIHEAQHTLVHIFQL